MTSHAHVGHCNEFSQDCLICRRPAYCRHYGVVSCDACKMFFRRTIIEKLTYFCKADKNCLEPLELKAPFCRACRLQRCLDLGMEYVPETVRIREFRNRRDGKLTSLLRSLSTMESSWYSKLVQFYSEGDPSLGDILEGKQVVVTEKDSEKKLNPEEWSFFDIYLLVISFMKLDFVQQLSSQDRTVLFKHSTMKTILVCSSMRAVKDKRESVSTPDGQEVYPPELAAILNIDPLVLRRISIPSLSDDARSILSTQQKMYTSALFQYCQVKYQQAAPSRLTELLSLCHVINKVYEDMQYLVMMFQCSMPVFKYHQLSIDTLELADNVQNLNRDEN